MDIKNISFIGNDERIKLNPSILKLKDYYIISYRISSINDKNFRYNFNLENKDGVKFNDIYNQNISNPDKVKKTPFEYVYMKHITDFLNQHNITFVIESNDVLTDYYIMKEAELSFSVRLKLCAVNRFFNFFATNDRRFREFLTLT